MSSFYDEYANFYNLIARDRDFRNELNSMGVFEFQSSGVFCELFAGPAYHSTDLKGLGWQGEIIAVDTSNAMKTVAIENGFQGNYIVDDAIAALRFVGLCDIMCIPRFSIVLVAKDYVRTLFASLSKNLTASGRLYIELHKIAANTIPLESRWNDLAIKSRVIKDGDDTIECVWPISTRVVSQNPEVVEMTIALSKSGRNGSFSAEFKSLEHLHRKSDIEEWALEAGLREKKGYSFETPTGHYLCFELVDELNFSPNSKTIANSEIVTGIDAIDDPLPLDVAFLRHFDLSTKETMNKLLEVSCLDIETHDSPLSRHVYNLL